MKTFLRILSIIIIIFGLMPWTDEEGTQKALRYSGFTNVRTNGHSFFTCMSDWSATEFYATTPVGLKKVSGTVCCGLLMKACTIRW
jgi:hypothetical protein